MKVQHNDNVHKMTFVDGKVVAMFGYGCPGCGTEDTEIPEGIPAPGHSAQLTVGEAGDFVVAGADQRMVLELDKWKEVTAYGPGYNLRLPLELRKRVDAARDLKSIQKFVEEALRFYLEAIEFPLDKAQTDLLYEWAVEFHGGADKLKDMLAYMWFDKQPKPL